MLEPPNAPHIFITDQTIHLVLPGPKGNPHQLHFNDDDAGWAQIAAILRSRKTDSKLGERGDPTKYQIETKSIDYGNVPIRRVGLPKIELKVSTTEILRRIGLI